MRIKIISFLYILFILAFQNQYAQTIQHKDSAILQQYISEGLKNYKSGDYKNALEYFNNAIKLDSTKSIYYCYRSDTKKLISDYNGGIADADKAITLAPLSDNGYAAKANSEFNLYYFEKALVNYTKAINLNPKNSKRYVFRGYCYYELGKFKEALADYDIATKMNTSESILDYYKGLLFFEIKEYDKAILAFNIFIPSQHKKNRGIVYYYRGECNLRLNRNDLAIKDFEESLKKDADIIDNYKSLGVCYTNLYDTINMRKNFDIAVQKDSTNANYYYTYAVNEQYLNNCQKALVLLNKFYELITHSKKKLAIGYYLNLALAKGCLGDTISALENFNKAEKSDSNEVLIYKDRLEFLFFDTLYINQMIYDASKLIILVKDTTQRPYLYSFSGFLKMANGDSLGAEKDFKKSLETETDKQFLYYNIACYYLMRPTSIYKEKVKYYFSKALDLNDSLIGAYKLLAYEYIQEGNIKEAIKTLEKAEKRHAKTIYGEDLKQCRIAFENEFKKGIKTNYDMDLIYYYPGQSSIIQRILKEAEKKSSISKKRIKL